MEEYELQELTLNLDPPGGGKAGVEEVCGLLKAVLLAGGVQHISISNETRNMHVVRYVLPGTDNTPRLQTADSLLAEFRALAEVEEFECETCGNGLLKMLGRVSERGLVPIAFLCWSVPEVMEWLSSTDPATAQHVSINRSISDVPFLVAKDIPSGVLVLVASTRLGLNSTFGIKTTMPIDAADTVLEFGVPRIEDDRRTENGPKEDLLRRDQGDRLSISSQVFGDGQQSNHSVQASTVGGEVVGWRAWIDRPTS